MFIVAFFLDLSMETHELMIKVNSLRLAAKNLAAYVNWPGLMIFQD